MYVFGVGAQLSLLLCICEIFSRGNYKYIDYISKYKLPVPVPKAQYLTSCHARKISKLEVKKPAC